MSVLGSLILALLAHPSFAAGQSDDEDLKNIAKMFKGITFSSDLRVRYEGIFDDTAAGDNRGRYRFRAGFTKQFGDFASLTFRGASGSTADPTSENQTFTGNFTPKTFHVSQIYGAVRPWPWLELKAGKMPTPMFRTSLVWDADLNPEGAAETFKFKTGRGLFIATLGQFFINSSSTTEDGYLLAYQSGWQFESRNGARWMILPSYTQVIRPNSTLAVGLNGNLTNAAGTALVSDFRIINIPVKFETTLGGKIPFALELDYAKNRGARALAGRKYDEGFLAELALGREKNKGDQMFKYRYADIDPDAVLSAFADSDFSFTNSRGHRFELDYVPWNHLKLTAAAFLLKPVRASTRPDRVRIQIDALLWF